MGVEFYTCDNCGSTFPDCGEYVSCETCWTKWHYVPDSCKYCRKEDYTDNVLLDYCMELLGVTRDQLVEKYNNR